MERGWKEGNREGESVSRGLTASSAHRSPLKLGRPKSGFRISSTQKENWQQIHDLANFQKCFKLGASLDFKKKINLGSLQHCLVDINMPLVPYFLFCIHMVLYF